MDQETIIAVVAISAFWIMVPAIVWIRRSARQRELLHLERMKALELGRPAPGESTWPQAFALASIGAGVPLGSFFITWMAWMGGRTLGPDIFLAPTGVSCVALLCSIGLARRLFPSPGKAAAARRDAAAKPQYDPDAYEMAGR